METKSAPTQTSNVISYRSSHKRNLPRHNMGEGDTYVHIKTNVCIILDSKLDKDERCEYSHVDVYTHT